MNHESEVTILKNSIYTPKKPTWFKRILASFLDLILFAVLLTGMMLLLSYVIGYQHDLELLTQKYIEYGVYILNKDGQYEFCSEASSCMDAWKAFNQDALAIQYYDSVAMKTLPITIGGVFLSELILEFIIPLFLKNGRTIGMFCLGIAYLDKKDIQITHIQLFIRFLFGKFIVVSVLPLFCFYLHFFNIWPTYGLVACLAFVIGNLIMKFVTERRVGFADAIGSMYMVENEAQVYVKTTEELSKLKAEELKAKEKQKKTY